MTTSTIWGPTVIAIDQDLRDALERTMLDIQYFMEVAGKVYLGLFEAGVEVTATNQFIRKDYNFYVPNADAVLPFTLTGDWAIDRLNFTLDSSGGSPSDFGLYIRTVESFGVIGDGVADDTLAFSEVCAYNGKVIGHPGLNIKTNSITWAGPVQLDMQGGKITLGSAGQRFTFGSTGIKVKNTIFDANLLAVNVAMFRIQIGFGDFVFENCVFKNIQGTAGLTNQYAFYIDADNIVGRISNCHFAEISAMSTPAPVSAFCGSMLISAASVGPKNFTVENCLIEEIYSTNIAGDINNSDADGIRFFGPIPSVAWNAHVINNTIRNVQKSGIKTSGTKGINIIGNKIVGDRADISMIAGIRLQASDDSVMTNNVLSGRMSNVLNLRSKNLVVNGVVYTPIDEARDWPTLLQFQSGDASITELVKVSNVIGRNIGQVIDFDSSGVTLATAFQFISISNVDVTARNVASGGTPSRVMKCAHISFENIRFFDPSRAWINCIDFNSVQNLTFKGCRFEARRAMFTWTQGTSGISAVDFEDCYFYRADASQGENFPVVDLRDETLGSLNRINILNCRMSIPSVATASQNFAIRMVLGNSTVMGLNIRIRTGQANGLPGYVYGVALACKFSDIHISADDTLAYAAGVGYGVALLSGSVSNMITDISNNTGRGVQLQAGANNNLASNIAGKLNSLSNAGTGNVAGDSLVYP